MSFLNRRSFLGAVGAALPAAAQSRARTGKPNFIIILADDLGYGDLACYGSRTNRTPNLDNMAREGIRFTDAYVPMPFCAPTRAALLTGRYPFRNGMVNNPAPDNGINDVALRKSEVTIAEALKSAGYASICTGKWHLGHTREFLPRTQGFDEYYGILYSNDMRPVQIVHNEEVAQYPVVQSNLTKDYTSRALSFIDKNKDRPFFLYLPHAMPHKPLAASEEFYMPPPEGRLYADVIRELDWSVGRILAKVSEAGLDENTLVIFTSDNGPWFGGSTAGLRGMKGSTWEGGIRVPFIARWPGKIPGGQTSAQICGVIDLLPTLCHLAQAPLPAGQVLDGRNIWPLMNGSGAATPHEAIVAMGGNQVRAVRSGKWKLHARVPAPGFGYMEDASRWIDPRGPDGITLIAPYEQPRPDEYPGLRTGPEPKAVMLFNLETDPGEQHDVAGDHPDVVTRLKVLFDRIDAQAPQTSPPAPAGRRLMRLQGGELRYDRLPAASVPLSKGTSR